MTTTKSTEEQIKELEELIKTNKTTIIGFKTSIGALLKENKEAEEKIKKLEKADKEQKEEKGKVDNAVKSAKAEADLMVAEIQAIQNLLKK